MAKETNETLTETLLRQVDTLDRYHDHKEKMAWGASTLYLTFTIVVIRWITTRDNSLVANFLQNNKIDAVDLVAYGVTVLVLLCTLGFAAMQFRMRWFAADESVVVRKYLYTIQLGVQKAENIIHIREIKAKANIYPDELQKKINILWAKRTGRAMLKATFGLFSKGTDDRYKSEIPTYAAIILFWALQVVVLYLHR